MARKHDDGHRCLIVPDTIFGTKGNPWVWQEDTRRIRTPQWLRHKTWGERKIQRQIRRMHQLLNRLGMAKTLRGAWTIDVGAKDAR